MKLSSFQLINSEREAEEILQQINTFNDTKANFPKGKSIHALFEEQAALYPNKEALVDEDTSMTYRELSRESDRLAGLIRQCGIPPGSIIGLLLDNSVQTIVAILGVLKAGGAYLPISPELPYERIKFIVTDSQVPFVISEKKYIKTLNKLQWECATCSHYICLDCDDIDAEIEPVNELMREDLWDYIGEVAHDDISAGAWFSSFTGEDLSRESMDEYAENILLKLKSYLHKNTRVLEIGCSSGISLFRIAPLVGEYIGTDLSAVILKGTEAEVKKRGLQNVRLLHLPAHQIQQLGEKAFDIVILNSVVQCFNGHNYLRKILRDAIGMMKEEGFIFLGDLQDQDKKDQLIEDILSFEKQHAARGYKIKTDWSNELFLSKRFFEDFQLACPAVIEIIHSDKIGNVENELAKYRFDTLLRIHKKSGTNLQDNSDLSSQKYKKQYDRRALANSIPRPSGVSTSPDDLAYIIYTSGSTGQPKGCQITHENVVRLMKNDRFLFDFSHTDVWIMAHAYNFDFSVWEMYGALLYGGKLIIPRRETVKNVNQFYETIRKHQITVLNQTPLSFRYLTTVALEDPEGKLDEHLRYVIFGGDRLDPVYLQPWQEKYDLSSIKLVNMYGITETTVHVTYHEITKADIQDPSGRSPIGVPLPETKVYVYNEGCKVVPVGVTGELFVGGTGVCCGYLNQKDLTEERFIENPYLPGERLYKTGDLGRWLENGTLEIVGRTDDQVKIRGYRIELAEIKQVLLQHPWVKDCEVMAVHLHEASEISEKELVAYMVPHGEVDHKALRKFLASYLPDYMVPSHFVNLSKIPVTSNGKINKKALPSPLQEDKAGKRKVLVPPVNETEQQLLEIWQEVLGRQDMGCDENFFELGGHSLKATQVTSRIYQKFNIQVKLVNMFTSPTIQQMAEVVTHAQPKTYQEIIPLPLQSYYELSDAQKRLWILDQFETGQVAYNIPGAFWIKGKFDVRVFEKVLDHLTRRHEILRTTFTLVNGVPKQMIHPAQVFPFQVQYTHLNGIKDQEKTAREWASKEAHTPFDLQKAPLLRVRVLELATDRFVLLFTMHHIISDGWSIKVMMQEIALLYQAITTGVEDPLPPLRIQYKDYAAWQNEQLKGDILEKHRAYWLEQLSDEVPVMHFPTDFHRPPVKTFHGHVVRESLSTATVDRLRELGYQQGTSLFIVLLASVKALLHRYTQEEDILVGTTTAGRNHQELENQLGFYVNTLVLRNQVKGEDHFSDFLNSVKDNTLQAFAHEAYPFDRLVNELGLERDRSRSPLFDVIVELLSLTLDTQQQTGMDGLEIEPLERAWDTCKYDLSFRFIEENQRVFLELEYNTDLFKQETIRRMIRHYFNLLEAIVTDPQQSIYQLDLLSPIEKQELLLDNQLQQTNPVTQTVIDLFERQVAKTPENVALIFQGKSLTFSELDHYANRLAHALLLQHRVQKNAVVALYLNHSEWLVISVLGILKAGAAFLPLDVSLPRERLAFMLKDTDVKVLVTDSHLMFDAVTFHNDSLMAVDLELETQQEAAVQAYNLTHPHGLSHVIFTSGSTGNPKGVAVSHASLANYIQWANTCYFENKTGFSFPLFTRLSFDLTLTSIFSPLLRGDQIYIYPLQEEVDQTLKDIFENEGQIKVVKMTPTHAGLLGLMEVACTSVEQVILGGEAVSPDHIRILKSLHPAITIYNEYGPTEATVGCMIKKLEDIGEAITIGKAIDNTQIFITDPYLNLHPKGVPGEICIAGAALARGYVNDVRLTAEKFVIPPFYKGIVYRTGDVGKMLPNGEILFLGRKDDQIKIRGYRIEPAEIVEALRKIPGIRDAYVTSLQKNEKKDTLIAYLLTDEKWDTSQLQERLAHGLPAYMVPTSFIAVAHFPYTKNGKLNINKLPKPDSLERAHVYQAPRNNEEERMVKIWEEVLERPGIGVNDDFFSLGGHSLKAVQLVSRIHKYFQVRLELGDIFNLSTIEAIAKKIKAAAPLQFEEIQPLDAQEYYELSYAQKRLWVLHELEEDPTAYNLPGAFEMEGKLDVEAFKNAWLAIIHRHESLRTCYTKVQSQPKQFIKSPDDTSFALQYLDWRNSENQERQWHALLRATTHHRFDLEKGPLLVGRLVHLHEHSFYFLLNIHHIISDEWSMQLLAKELLLSYNAYRNGETQQVEALLSPLKIQYKDYAAWQNKRLSGELLSEHQQYWLDQFRGELPVLNLMTDRIRPALKTYHGNQAHHVLNIDIAQRVKTFAQEQDTSLFITLLTSVYVFLYRYTYQEDMVIGTPVAGRDHVDLENQIGFYVNTLPLRNQLNGHDSFEETLRNIRANTLAAFSHQMYPFDKLVNELNLDRDLSRSPLFDIMVIMQEAQAPLPLEKLGELSIKPVNPGLAISKYDLTFIFQDGGNDLSLDIEYNTDLFDERTIERMYHHFEALLSVIFDDPTKPIASASFIPTPEKHCILSEFNSTAGDHQINQTLPQLFEEQVGKSGEKVALVFGDQKLTYQALNEKSNYLAHYLRDVCGVSPGSLVGVWMDRSIEMVIALLGILKTGGAYVPIDPDYPLERIQYMLQDTHASVVIVRDLAPEFTGKIAREITLVDILELWPQIETYSPENCTDCLKTNDLAYVIYTSGSTGKPKGVALEHAGVVNRIAWMWKHYQFSEDDVILQKTPFVFDVSVWEFWMTLCYGATLVLCPKAVIYDPPYLIDYVDQYAITTLHFVPSMLNAFIDAINPQNEKKLLGLKRIFASGEALLPDTVQNHYQKVSVPLFNLYGPTEASVDVTYYDTKIEDTHIPIGKPIQNIQMLIVDDDLNLVPIGVPGEICISGVGLARGYINHPILTHEQFVNNPYRESAGSNYEKLYRTGDIGKWLPNGNIAFLGRKDDQVKIRGHRIELGEIDNILLKYPAIVEARTLLKPDLGRNPLLVAYYRAKEIIDPATIAVHLNKFLPDYMVPSFFIPVETFPLTASGKIDRKALPNPYTSEVESGQVFVEPRNETEEMLVAIWQQVLYRKSISIRDNFFMMGGDSIKAIQVSAHLYSRGFQVHTRDIFKYPTIESLSQNIKKTDWVSPDRVSPDQSLVVGQLPMTPVQKAFFDHPRTALHHYNQAIMLESEAGFEVEMIHQVFTKIMEHHDALRMRFPQVENRRVAEIQDLSLGFDLKVHDLEEEEDPWQNLHTMANELQASIDLEQGPLVKLGLFRLNTLDCLLIAMHHLVIDGVSWRILFEDLETLYRQYQRGEKLMLPPKTDSYKYWAEQLSEYANSQEFLAQKIYWEQTLSSEVQVLPKDKDTTTGNNRDIRACHVALDREQTTALLTEVNRTFNTEINDILVTGLVLSMHATFGMDNIMMALEGHGREDILPGLDVSRTIGWFTTIYPVIFQLGRQDDLAQQIKMVKETLHRVPDKGIGYGLLKFLSDEKHRSSVHLEKRPQVIFNFLGNVDADLEQFSFRISKAPSGYTQHPDDIPLYDWEVSAIIAHQQLEISLYYSQKQFHQETIQQVLARYKQILDEIIRLCLQSEHKSLVTPSDLGYKDLSMEDLENFFHD